jgi:hypothetical protein
MLDHAEVLGHRLTLVVDPELAFTSTSAFLISLQLFGHGGK